jgi:hypothetical protein
MKTDTLSGNFANRLTTNYFPCVRYGFSEDSDNPRQDPRLRLITEPIPEEAETVSPVYLLTQDQFRRQAALENPYQVRGAENIAKSLQDECEDENRVIYPLHVESDKYLEYGSDTLLEWFRTLVEDYLGMDPEDCVYYHSGSRSIHLHVPSFLVGESDRVRNKEEIQKFSNKTGAEFDLGLYDRKRQFRLPGVVHQKTGFPKVQIGPYWDEDQIIEALTKTIPTIPRTYADVLAAVYGRPPEAESPRSPGTLLPIDDILALLGGPEQAISFSDQKINIEVPLVEQQLEPATEGDIPRWRAYNDKEFSPYAKTGNGERSVAVVEPVGGMFARNGVRNGATLVPAYFYGAKGGDGGFVKYRVHAPLQLSEGDRKKWDPDFKFVVIIGGRSRQARFIEVDRTTASITGLLLHPEDGSRQEALAYLEKQGYDVGSSGRASTRKPKTAGTRGDYEQVLPAIHPHTEAGELQRRAEQEGIQTLDHNELIRVACRLFYKYPSWDPVWRWFQKQYGEDFKPKVAWTQLRSVADGMDADIDVPECP